MTVRQRAPRIRNEKHLKFCRTLPCIICKNDICTEACHIRMSDPSIGKELTGIGQKPHDFFVLPMCGKCHREQHNGSEHRFWAQRGIDPVKIALALFSVSGDYESGIQIIEANHVP